MPRRGLSFLSEAQLIRFCADSRVYRTATCAAAHLRFSLVFLPMGARLVRCCAGAIAAIAHWRRGPSWRCLNGPITRRHRHNNLRGRVSGGVSNCRSARGVRGVRQEVSARVVCERLAKVPASFSCRRDGATPLKGRSGTSRPELPAKATAQIVFHRNPAGGHSAKPCSIAGALDLLLFGGMLYSNFLFGSCRRLLLSGTGGLKLLVGWLRCLHQVLLGWRRQRVLWVACSGDCRCWAVAV